MSLVSNPHGCSGGPSRRDSDVDAMVTKRHASDSKKARRHEASPKPKQSVVDRRAHQTLVATVLDEEAVSRRCCGLRWLAGRKPMVTPSSLTLDLLFFRRVFSSLVRRSGTENGEVPISCFQRSILRIFRLLGVKDAEFDAEEYDADGSGVVGWYEFVSCWQKSKACIILSTAERIFLAMEDPGICFLGQAVSCLVTALILISCIVFIVGTLPAVKKQDCGSCEPKEHEVFHWTESFCIGVFTLEYLLRLCTAPFSRSELLDYDHILDTVTGSEELKLPSTCKRFVNFVLSPMNLIDVFVIAPFYFEVSFDQAGAVSNFTVLRVLRLTRLMRLIKLGSYLEDVELLLRVFSKSHKMLYMLGVYMVLGLCFSSAAMYYVEAGSWDPEARDYYRTGHDGTKVPTPFKSIPHAFWWCIVTFTTVGYGDIAPVTLLGKLVASATMVFGILVLAMPISVISMNFSTVWSDWSQEKLLEASAREEDLNSVSAALEQLENRKILVVQLYDTRHGREAPEFLGEVRWDDLPVDSEKVEQEERLFPLQPKWDKWEARNMIRGSILIGFAWNPAVSFSPEDSDKASGCRGRLEVKIRQAQGLPRSDWKKHGLRDVFAEVQCWPKPPNASGEFEAETFRTSTAAPSLDPMWEQARVFDFDWPADLREIFRIRPPRADGRSNTETSIVKIGDSAKHSRNLEALVEAQGRDIRHLATQVIILRDMLNETRTGLIVAGGGASACEANVVASGLKRRTPTSSMIIHNEMMPRMPEATLASMRIASRPSSIDYDCDDVQSLPEARLPSNSRRHEERRSPSAASIPGCVHDDIDAADLG